MDENTGEPVQQRNVRTTPAEYRAADKARLEAAVAAGELEPTKTFSKYVCPTADCGKSSLYTGSLGPDRCFDGYSGRFCRVCGVELIEDGPERFVIEFESVSATAHPELYDWSTERARQDVDHASIPDEWWTTTRRQASEHSIRGQFKGLHLLIEEGEFIRNVRVSETVEEPTFREVDTSAWSAPAHHSGSSSPPTPNPPGADKR